MKLKNKDTAHITLSIIVICFVAFGFWHAHRPRCHWCHQSIVGKVYEKCGYVMGGDNKAAIYFRILCKECMMEAEK